MVEKRSNMSIWKHLNNNYKRLMEINNSRSEFIDDLLKAFEKDHPEFIEQLRDRGLNEEEIKFCCLEVLG